MRATSLLLATPLVLSCVLALDARAQPSAGASAATGTPTVTTSTPRGTTWVASPAMVGVRPPDSLLARVGAGAATRLMRSNDPAERLRGLEQAAGTHTPESLALLERAAGTDASKGLDPRMPPEGIARTDPRAVLAVVRGLAEWTDHETARAALATLLSAPGESFAVRVTSAPSRDPAADETDGAARLLLARREAAVALAASGNTLAIEALVALARGLGPGRGPALDALALHPPSAPLALGGAALTTPAMIGLAAEIGDLRTIDTILGAVNSTDPALRAAAITALGVIGDMRATDLARTAVHDDDARVRVAAAGALVHLGAPDAAGAVAALVGDDATALDGLRLARDVQDEEVTRAAAARATAPADPALRAAALEELGRQVASSAVRALQVLVADPTIQGDAMAALARSPSPAAMGALESLGSGARDDRAGALRRLAARGYLVRRFSRGDRSEHLDGVLRALGDSADARDRAVGTEALVALGERPLRTALADADPRVRRAGVLGAMGRWEPDSGERLLEREAIEQDRETRTALAFGLIDVDADRGSHSVPTLTLVERAGAGGADAALATMALARRTDERVREVVDALLASHDPVLRAHAARGLGESPASDATGRLAQAYAWEGDTDVRRAILSALAARTAEVGAGARTRTLELAARLEPDRLARWTAQAGLAARPPEGGSRNRKQANDRLVREVLWIRLTAAEGATMPADEEATLIRSDGLAVPISFDDEGYALVPGVPPGEGRVRLAPSQQSYSAPAP